MDKIEGWLLNVFAGKLVAREAVTIAAAAMAPAIQAVLAKYGVHYTINSTELAVGMIAGAHAAFEWFKARRMANPNSPAVQTDARKPNAEIPARIPDTVGPIPEATKPPIVIAPAPAVVPPPAP